MDTQYGDEHYWTTFVEDRKKGCAGFQIHRECRGLTIIAGQILYWDATAKFCFETFDTDVPVEIVQAAITEAKERINLA